MICFNVYPLEVLMFLQRCDWLGLLNTTMPPWKADRSTGSCRFVRRISHGLSWPGTEAGYLFMFDVATGTMLVRSRVSQAGMWVARFGS